MDISYNSDIGNMDLNVGYGVAGFKIVSALERQGHRVLFADNEPPVEFFFSQPEYWDFSSDSQYKIGYIPWESTRVPASWHENVKTADEIWTPSDWCRDVLRYNGIHNVKVFPHGVDHAWEPNRRNIRDQFRFLHIGEPAYRKGGQMTVDAFAKLFRYVPDVELVIKAYEHHTLDLRGLENVTVITDGIEEPDLIELVQDCHCLVYPSWGEGFGMIPLQAVATGMPTISTSVWADYRRYLDPLQILSMPEPSPWPDSHPGMMYRPDERYLAMLMEEVYFNYDKYSNIFFDRAPQVHLDYDWDRLVSDAFDPIVKQFG